MVGSCQNIKISIIAPKYNKKRTNYHIIPSILSPYGGVTYFVGPHQDRGAEADPGAAQARDGGAAAGGLPGPARPRADQQRVYQPIAYKSVA